MSDTYCWAQMLDDFRQLGGTADNIEQRVGQFGNGIFPLNPAEMIEIDIPESLLVDVDKLVLDGDDLVVDPDAGVPAEVCEFHARYQKHFSWGADGRTNVEAFESSLKELPEPVLVKLRQLHLLNLDVRHKGQWNEVLRQCFLNSRKINYHKRKVSMPIIELINHASNSPGYIIKESIKVRGTFADEVTVNYNPNTDTLVRFLTYGFANQEPNASSFPTRFNAGDGRVIVIGNDSASINLVDKLPLPKVEEKGKQRKLSHLRLALEKTPRLPKTLFRKVMSDLPADAADEIFDRIRNANILELCNLLELTEGVVTPVCTELRRAVLYQMKALTHCFGVRPEKPAAENLQPVAL